jgi:hypothetical protein
MISKFHLLLILFVFSFGSTIAQIKNIPDLIVRNFKTPSSTIEARLQDLQVFEDIVDVNASFNIAKRAEAKISISKLRLHIYSKSELEFLIELHRIYALSENAHDEGRFALFPRGWGSMPFRGYWFDSQYRIIRVLPGYEELLGARITHYGNVAIDEVNVKLKVLCGGTLDFFRSVAGDPLMTTPAVLHYMNIIPSDYKIEVHLVMLDGTTDIRVLKPSPSGRTNNPSTASGRLLFPNFKFDNWIAFVPKPIIPIYLEGKDPLGFPFIYKELGSKGIPFVQLRQNRSTEKQNLKEFIQKIENTWKGKKFPLLIIDLRLNQGGNTLLTQKFFQSLDQYVEQNGKIYVTLGKRTISAGMNAAALIKHGNTSEVIFIGEDVGDREQYWSETNRVSLPNNSDIKFTYSAAKHDLENGCNLPECYWWYFENSNPKIGELRPDIYVPFTFDDYLKGRDSILDKIEIIENVDLSK